MIEAGFAQLRYAASVAFGRRFSLGSLDHLVAAIKDARAEFGALGAESSELLGGLALSEEDRREMQLSRFKKQARLAASETAYYRRLFQELSLDPGQLTNDGLLAIPLTSKEAVRSNPDAFVRSTAKPFLRALTTGTTGRPTSICFSDHELRVYFALSAISYLLSQEITAEDIVQISTSARGTLGNSCVVGACAYVGAQVYMAGVVDPALTLSLLAEERHLTGKCPRASILVTYPSFLGELVETGLAMGYRPSDFGLRNICIGGELVSQGLKRRVPQLFGEVSFIEGYGMTETWPLSGALCSENHLHFEPSQALVEVYNHQIGTLAKPGETGTIVATPLPPYRETTLLLRYDTGDAVRAIAGPFKCSRRNLPATSHLLGKQSLAIRHNEGWTFPRQLIEGLEAVEGVPLPARFSFWPVDNGVAVEVVTPHQSPSLRANIEQNLEEQGVPLRELHLVESRSSLRRPYPLRGDLRESSFDQPSFKPGLVN